MTINGLNAALAAILLAFGVTVPMPAFAGGMIVALGCCFLVMSARPITARRGLSLTLMMGVFAALLAAILHEPAKGLPGFLLWGRLPLQAQMGAAGALSQALFELVASRGSGWLGKLADKAGIPGPGAEGDGQ